MFKFYSATLLYILCSFFSVAQSNTYTYSINGKDLKPCGIIQNSTDHIYLIANSGNNRELYVSYTKSLDSTTIWTKAYKDCFAFDFVLDQENNLIVAGQSFNNQALALKINRKDGSVDFRISKESTLRYRSIINNNKGEFVLVGNNKTNGDLLFLDIVDSKGNSVNQKTYNIGNRTITHGLCQLKNGNYVLAGGINYNGKMDPMIIIITSNKAYSRSWNFNGSINKT